MMTAIKMRAFDCDIHLEPRGAVSTTLNAIDGRAAKALARRWAQERGYWDIERVVVRPVGEKVGPDGGSWE
jgi:hypothetical protein